MHRTRSRRALPPILSAGLWPCQTPRRPEVPPSAGRRADEALEDLPPALGHRAAQALRGLAEALEVPVLEVDSRPLETERRESHLDLREERRVVLEVRTELPGQHEPPRGIPL